MLLWARDDRDPVVTAAGSFTIYLSNIGLEFALMLLDGRLQILGHSDDGELATIRGIVSDGSIEDPWRLNHHNSSNSVTDCKHALFVYEIRGRSLIAAGGAGGWQMRKEMAVTF